jgi:hypothetical protein
MVGTTRPPFPSAPSEPSLRRLGTGNPGPSDRPIRAQLVVALVALIIILAVPLYLWRRPSSTVTSPDAGVPSAPTASLSAAAVSVASATVPVRVEAVRTNPLQRVRCGASRTKATASLPCDALPILERAFVEAIQKTTDCAPRTSKEGTINFVLEVDFVHKSLHVFPGKSGDWHGPSSRRATKCVEKALGKPELVAMTHNYAYYALAVLATYPAAGSAVAPVPSLILPTPYPAGTVVSEPVIPGAAVSATSGQ